MTFSDMDAHRLSLACRPASGCPRTARRLALASAATGLALLLSGCDVDRVSALEERINQVEAKAEAAEKRAKAAQALAATNQSQPIVQPDPAPITDDNADADSSDNNINDGSDAQPPPMADNGKG